MAVRATGVGGSALPPLLLCGSGRSASSLTAVACLPSVKGFAAASRTARPCRCPYIELGSPNPPTLSNAAKSVCRTARKTDGEIRLKHPYAGAGVTRGARPSGKGRLGPESRENKKLTPACLRLAHIHTVHRPFGILPHARQCRWRRNGSRERTGEPRASPWA